MLENTKHENDGSAKRARAAVNEKNPGICTEKTILISIFLKITSLLGLFTYNRQNRQDRTCRACRFGLRFPPRKIHPATGVTTRCQDDENLNARRNAIEILNGGEISVNCKSKLNRNLNSNISTICGPASQTLRGQEIASGKRGSNMVFSDVCVITLYLFEGLRIQIHTCLEWPFQNTLRMALSTHERMPKQN